MLKILTAGCCLFFFHIAIVAQDYLPFGRIRQFTQTQKPSRYDSTRKGFINRLGNDLHYLYPLYQGLGWESKFKLRLGRKRYYQALSEYLAFAGDYSMANKYATLPYDPLKPISRKALLQQILDLKDIQSAEARTYITGKAMSAQVVMIDESPAKPIHRAFTYSLLENLYNMGFRYLAMETFNNKSNRSLQGVNCFTGEYTSEPVGGEMVRKALELGYTLVAYDDTLASKHSVVQQDSIQAENLYRIIKNDKKARILVHGRYWSVAEKKTGYHMSMAMRFKQLSGIDPLTIEQTDLTEGSNFEYGRVFYDYFTDKFTITEPSVIMRNRVPLNLLEQYGYDIIVIHPPTVYKNGRPTWLSLNGEKKEVLINYPVKDAFYIQAYYHREWREDAIPQLIPADQTYNREETGYSLYLRPGMYMIVTRDHGYKVLSVNIRSVK
jgi:hypothetical protein